MNLAATCDRINMAKRRLQTLIALVTVMQNGFVIMTYQVETGLYNIGDKQFVTKQLNTSHDANASL